MANNLYTYSQKAITSNTLSRDIFLMLYWRSNIMKWVTEQNIKLGSLECVSVG